LEGEVILGGTVGARGVSNRTTRSSYYHRASHVDDLMKI
jgi:hypothetical protein